MNHPSRRGWDPQRPLGSGITIAVYRIDKDGAHVVKEPEESFCFSRDVGWDKYPPCECGGPGCALARPLTDGRGRDGVGWLDVDSG
ncbi:hypothetical protein [Embleya sp. NBC_00896]|uniref:hypothetical protein n=1 Tax=Embleya sp. NBC_00896 TaxID=2975961 RepID=UPI002F915998|nr:hypothetical protein OG928_40595 [Embleya sp. NBC_00896]